MLLILTLCVAAFLAGLVDSMVGGGGLIQLPVMLILLPSTPIATLLGTNKFVAITGTSMAAFQYAGVSRSAGARCCPWRLRPSSSL
jgi:uncharacterized membrane protein YfcA